MDEQLRRGRSSVKTVGGQRLYGRNEIGVLIAGETAEDLVPFDAPTFVDSLFD